MAVTKKVFVGSLFEFTTAGADEIINGFRDQFVEPESVPFISYDRNTNLFSCDVDVNDHDLIPLLNAQINAYTILHHKKPDEPLESDKLVRIEGTVLHDETHPSGAREQEQNQLLNLDLSSEDDEVEPHLENDTTYWKPKCGDTTILTTEIAHEIADTTGTWLIPDSIEPKVKLKQGNLQLTLEKLRRLEEILIQSAPHRSGAASCVDSNLHLLPKSSESTIKFVRPVQPLCGFDRIFLDPAQTYLHNQLMISEIRIWETTRRIKPVNLDLEGVSLTAKFGASSIFGKSPMSALGDAKNAEPRPSSKENSQTSDEPQRPGSPTKYLGQKDTERVEEWRGNIDPNAVPTLPPEAPAPEEEKKTGRRRVIQDSSDEEDDDEDDKLQSQQIKPELDSVPRSIQSEKSWESVVSTKVRESAQSNNVYDLLGFNETADQHASSSEDRASEISKGKSKQLNVTFQEPSSWDDSLSAVNKSSLPYKQENQRSFDFDETRYGLKEHFARKTHSHGSRKYTSHARENSSKAPLIPVSPLPRPLRRDDVLPQSQKAEHQHRRSDNQAGSYQPFNRRGRDLIDTTSYDQPSPEQTMPPPGLDYRSCNITDNFSSPIASYQQAVSPTYKRPATPPGTYGANSTITSGSSDPRLAFTGFTPQLTVPKRDINYMKDQAVARLKAQMEANSQRHASNNANKSTLPPNRIQKDDELGSRKYHKTMSQKTAKPGKNRKNTVNPETKVERDARIAKAKAEAYGDTKPAKAGQTKPQPKSQTGASPGDMTVKKRQILKNNSAMANLHQEEIAEIAHKDTAFRLAEELKPILQATRAFKGTIRVEVQLGQALALTHNRLSEASVYTAKDWTQLLNGKAQTDPKVIFTNMLTSNGQDIDRMLEMKADTESGKLWDKDDPGLSSVTFEFSCQDKSGQDFLFVLDQQGDYSLQKNATTIGKIAIHAPGQIWDACAVVSGTMKVLRPSEDVLTGAAQLRESLYCPGGGKAAIYYRLPPNNTLTIKAIVMKRVSNHKCLLANKEDIQMRVTEVKALAHSSNPTDKKLYRSYESSYEVMVNENRIHYEVAIVDISVEKVFEANPGIEIGELVPMTAPDGTIFSTAHAYALIEVTNYMLERIDWVGGRNVGTLRRIHESAAGQRASLANALPPGLNQNLPIPMGKTAPTTVAPTSYQSQHSRIGGGAVTTTGTTIAGANVVADQTPYQLQGIRAHTAAELYQDRSSGELFYYGQGGARIPVISEQVEGLRFDGQGPVLPSDSASQIGDARRKVVVPGSAAGRKAGWNDKPAGFW